MLLAFVGIMATSWAGGTPLMASRSGARSSPPTRQRPEVTEVGGGRSGPLRSLTSLIRAVFHRDHAIDQDQLQELADTSPRVAK
jgi:hypothetical protein